MKHAETMGASTKLCRLSNKGNGGNACVARVLRFAAVSHAWKSWSFAGLGVSALAMPARRAKRGFSSGTKCGEELDVVETVKVLVKQRFVVFGAAVDVLAFEERRRNPPRKKDFCGFQHDGL